MPVPPDCTGEAAGAAALPEPILAQAALPNWPCPPGVGALCTGLGVVSATTPWGFNLSLSAGETPAVVGARRQQLQVSSGVRHWQWLRQVHGTRIACVNAPRAELEADGLITARPGLALAVLTADCVPVLLWNAAADRVAAVHAGWRGLVSGVIGRAVSGFAKEGGPVRAYIGPAIGRAHYEVDAPVLQAMARALGMKSIEELMPDLAEPSAPGRARLDLAACTRRLLLCVGVEAVTLSGLCTHSQAFHSHRRSARSASAHSGRQASAIWLSDTTR